MSREKYIKKNINLIKNKMRYLGPSIVIEGKAVVII